MVEARIGIDLGGTKIEGIALDRGGVELFRRRTATPRDDYQGTLRAVADLVAAIESAIGGRATVGMGTPGAVSPATGLMKNANSTWLIGKPLEQDLIRVLGRPVRLANDADCFALSEAVDGAGAGARTVFGVIVGTGTGGGIVVDGRLVGGPNAVAGEWGHNPLPWPEPGELPGPPCYCGRHGCIETWLSGPGLARDYAGNSGGPEAAAEANAGTTPEEIVRRAEGGEAAAAAALDRYAGRMARALASVINILDPHVIVLGGGMSNIASVYREVPGRWGPFVFSDTVATRLLPPVHGDASGVRGAAWLWPPEAKVEAG
jgi:fructokinase